MNFNYFFNITLELCVVLVLSSSSQQFQRRYERFDIVMVTQHTSSVLKNSTKRSRKINFQRRGKKTITRVSEISWSDYTSWRIYIYIPDGQTGSPPFPSLPMQLHRYTSLSRRGVVSFSSSPSSSLLSRRLVSRRSQGERESERAKENIATQQPSLRVFRGQRCCCWRL